MKRHLILFFFLALWGFGYSQVYLDQFDEDQGNTFANVGMTSSFADSEWTITADGSSGPFETFGYEFVDDAGTPITVDVTENGKIYVRVKASSIGTQLRLDLVDSDGFVTSIDGLTKTVVNDYAVVEYTFTGYQDGGYGGTPCDSGSAPCAVNGAAISSLAFYINPGQGGYQGTVVMDFISVGTPPTTGPMSDVYQDVFDDEISQNYIEYGAGYNGTVENGIWTINGDGTAGPYNPMVYFPYNSVTLDSTDIDISLGDNKIYVRARGSVSGISLRCDAQDIDGFITTQGSVTKILTDEWVTYEYDLTGLFFDLGYGGTPCDATTAPCAVDPTRIGNFTFFITPGVEAFSGTVEIEYISIGTPLEAVDPTQNVLVYGDHFSDGILNAVADNFALEETDSELIISGDGNAPPYSSIAYTPVDKNTGEAVTLDLTGNNKIFLKGRSSQANTLVRMDLVDTAGFVTSLPSLTKIYGTDETVFEYDFTAQYIDAGYGGTACETGPCPVDPTVIATILLYPNPENGAFDGTLNFDFISTGGPMGEDIAPYSDQFDNDINVFMDVAGYTSSEAGGEAVLTGDGTGGAYAAYFYDLHNQDDGTSVLADFTLNDKLFVKAKSDVEGVPLRIDVIDEDGYVGNFSAVANSLTEEYVVYEYEYNAYQDGGYGGSPCDGADAPCDVDATRINSLLFYLDADNGAFSGNVTIDWISTQAPLEIIDNSGPKGQDDYVDDFNNDNATNTEGADGLEVTESQSSTIITGNGTSGEYSPVVFNLHNQADESSVLVNVLSNDDKMFIRAKSTVADLPVRIDFQDVEGYVTSLGSVTNNVTEEFTVIEYNYTGNYQDGGYGGTPCSTGPCSVDAERVQSLQVFLNPGVGAFDGVLEIDWISFGEPLVVNIEDTEKVFEAKVYPNPTDSEFVLYATCSNTVKNAQVAIYDLAGSLVFSRDFALSNGELNAKINVENLNSGMYIIQASSNGQGLLFDKIMVK